VVLLNIHSFSDSKKVDNNNVSVSFFLLCVYILIIGFDK